MSCYNVCQECIYSEETSAYEFYCQWNNDYFLKSLDTSKCEYFKEIDTDKDNNFNEVED